MFKIRVIINSIITALVLVAAYPINAQQPPNLIVILTDDQGYADVGFNGSTEIFTPNIDKIAKQGARITNGYVTYPVCGPSRAGLLTGRYQDRFGFVGNPTIDPTVNNAGIPLSEKNIAEVLQPAGYASAIIGKWHMGTHPDLQPNNRGFEHFFGFLSGGHRYFPEELNIEDLSEVTKKWQWYSTKLLRNKERVEITDYLTDELSNDAVDFIQRKKDQPFFLYLSYNAPHAPLQATEKYLKRYAHIKDERRRTYAAMISAVDDGVGRVLDTLQETGIDENTMVFFLSDNGGPLTKNASNNGELRGGKGDMFEGGVRVPFAVRWPAKIPAGIDYNQPVSSLDILATIVAESNIDMSANKPLDGVNLIPYLRGENNNAPHDVLFWRGYTRGMEASRTANAKMIKHKQQKMLFDLSTDIGESDNIQGNNSDDFDVLQDAYQQWNEQLQEPAFPRLGSWDFKSQNAQSDKSQTEHKQNQSNKNLNKGINHE
ncbi:N-acetylgalactosamine 6-sulfate sulfatase [Thalassotalea sp. HSM 43]|uniref:sulfatase-like hydrolase/transferase n=1 Tax=Thalassotalea sp. HSM 43 TaxID=2552945 RepID=UPI00108210DA|nr:sulfatase-like hydrolase/transferase [Thalassotalea sp. HSM 43]QBY04228.1 N-acetylgalactosamine 6-sulfate sulfatase [Thalassotalea sp. HSM 43]